MMHSYESVELSKAKLLTLVLILVLMDDALVRENKEARKTIKKGLNPCFNG